MVKTNCATWEEYYWNLTQCDKKIMRIIKNIRRYNNTLLYLFY